jgi:hypothetical protein
VTDKLVLCERFDDGGDEITLDSEYTFIAKTITSGVTDMTDEGNHMKFKVISKDLKIDDPSFSDGYESFDNMGYTDTDYMGK